MNYGYNAHAKKSLNFRWLGVGRIYLGRAHFIFLLFFLQTTTANHGFKRVAVTSVSIQSNDDDDENNNDDDDNNDDDNDSNTLYFGSLPQGKER